MLFGQAGYPIDLIIKEFQQDSNSFYQSLEEHRSKKGKEQGIEKFILSTYYQGKIKNDGLKIDLLDYEVRCLVSQNSEIDL